jgi:hypothetical protein
MEANLSLVLGVRQTQTERRFWIAQREQMGAWTDVSNLLLGDSTEARGGRKCQSETDPASSHRPRFLTLARTEIG